MGKENNLKDFLIDVANAIRTRKNINTLINPQEFSDEILSIKGNGGGINENAVNFFDYDGTLLYSYTLEEVHSLEQLPELPEHNGLICQGWNWDLEDVKALEYPMNIGAIYTTHNENTILNIKLDDAHLTFDLYFYQDKSLGVTIDWGDNTPTEKIAGVGKVTRPHTYQSSGTYTITLIPNDDCNICPCSAGTDNYYYSLRRVHMGRNCVIPKNIIFKNAVDLECITIPEGVESIPSAFWYKCSNLKAIMLPKTIAEIGMQICYECYRLSSVSFNKNARFTSSLDTFNNCRSLRSVCFAYPLTFDGYCMQNTNCEKITLPKGCSLAGQNAICNNYALAEIDLSDVVDLTGANALRGSYALKKLLCPRELTSFGNATFAELKNLRFIVLPQSLQVLTQNCFYFCNLLEDIKLPNSVLTIEDSAFSYCGNFKRLDCTSCSQVPTLMNINALQSVHKNLQILVPEDLYESWTIAPNWSSFTDNIVSAPRTTYDYDKLKQEYYDY